MTHSDLLHYITTTNFGHWGILLYVAAAVGALVSVAINSPPRTYTWFLLGPAIYSFLINTTQEVEGVDWTVAGRQQDMKEVWRNAETGAKNTQLIFKRQKIDFNKEDGPTGTYPVATALLYLDELFSTTTNLLVEWSGLYISDGTGASNSNLAAKSGQAEGPWYILSNSKWGLVENMTAATARNPNVRDSLVTFLTNECGDAFKDAISDGRFIAASTSRGAVLPGTVFKTSRGQDVPDFTAQAGSGQKVDYTFATGKLFNTAIPTPRGLSNLFHDHTAEGSFGNFSQVFDGGSRRRDTFLARGRDRSIVCIEYLYTVIQALRWESGHAYHQLLRSSPRGVDTQQFLRTLFYGWDIRKQVNAQYASDAEMMAFAKMVIFVHMLRNELLFAPQITKTDARYSPSDQSRNFAEAQIRSYGSKSKFSELYQWAVLMPHLQGILLYIIIIGYPFACMLMVIPGYWKAFFTWVTFFAWLKLWDVGFAIVQVLERSVWAMIGNNSNMARISSMMIRTAEDAGSVGASCAQAGTAQRTPNGGALDYALGELCAVPRVCSKVSIDGADCGRSPGRDQSFDQALQLLDRALIMGSGIDLDLSNGYYIYIMAALYFSVPMVTGQLVLGAKAGVASSVGGMFNGVASEAGRAAQTGRQHADVAALTTNAAALGQAAYDKSMRKGFAANALAAQKDAMEAGIDGHIRDGEAKFANSKAGVLEQVAGHRRQAATTVGIATGAIQSTYGAFTGSAGASAGGGGGAGKGGVGKGLTEGAKQAFGVVPNALYQFAADSRHKGAAYDAASNSMDAHWDTGYFNARKEGSSASQARLGKIGEFDAGTAAYEAKAAFSAHVSSIGGIAGMNAGAMAPPSKPQDMEAMAYQGHFNKVDRNGRMDNAVSDLAAFPMSFASSASRTYDDMKPMFGGQALSSHYMIGDSAGWNMGKVSGQVGLGSLSGVESFGSELFGISSGVQTRENAERMEAVGLTWEDVGIGSKQK